MLLFCQHGPSFTIQLCYSPPVLLKPYMHFRLAVGLPKHDSYVALVLYCQRDSCSNVEVAQQPLKEGSAQAEHPPKMT